MLGIDISIHNHDKYRNGKLPWDKIKAAGVDFVIIRTGAGVSYNDPYFVSDVNDAHSVGLKAGAYHYSYALSPSAAMNEAILCKNVIEQSGVLLELPIFFDMEDGDGYKSRHGFNFSKRHVTDICESWLKQIQPLNSGVYASFSWFENYIDWQYLHEKYHVPMWNAQYSIIDMLQAYMWQFTEILQIDGNFYDGNILYDEKHHPGLEPFNFFHQS